MAADKPIPHPSVHPEVTRLDRIKGYAVREKRTLSKPVAVATPSQATGRF